ncbi:hypothetical protein PoB_005524900 [Plakobranchus ocellatus]|uniref:Uncharacterized protein n=1 Tax=Plakobranchus ocellatus TaxID=259542 RepID=A0AAV4C854_9GAST|nr:hypothetical protein PoB_005524900 [Plakobranchus ocellatus]
MVSTQWTSGPSYGPKGRRVGPGGRRGHKRYLASVENHTSLSFYFLAGVSTVRAITLETCTVIWNILQPRVMPKPDKEQWLKIASDFFQAHSRVLFA